MATAKGTQTQGSTLTTPQVTAGASYIPTTTTGVTQTSSTSTSASYDKPDYSHTQAVTNAIYQNLMGKDATKQEIDYYHQKFLDYAAKHPTSVSTRTTNLGTGSTSERVSTSSTLSEQDYIANLARGTADAKEYKAATSYFDIMRQAMSEFGGGI